MMVLVYGVAEQQIDYGNDIAENAMLVGLGALQFGTGFALGRWWALLLPPATVILAMPAGYPDSNKGEPVTASTGLLVLSPLLIAAMGAGVGVARLWFRSHR